MKQKVRTVKATKPYRSYVDGMKTLSELVREDELNEDKKKVSKPSPRKKLFSCLDCELFVLTRIEDDKHYGYVKCAGKCIHM